MIRIDRLFGFGLLMVLTCSELALAGGGKGDFGIGLTVTESSPAFVARIWTGDSFSLEPHISFAHISPNNSGGITRWGPGLGIINHWRTGQELRPFFGARGELDILAGGPEKYVDVAVGPVFGAEYFLSDDFSVTGEYQLVFLFTDDVLSPSLNLQPSSTYINSVQLLGVTFYF